MKILFTKGNSSYGVLRSYADIVINYLVSEGHNVICVDRKKKGDWENVVDLIDDTFDIVISLQVLAFKIKVLLDKAGKKYPKLVYLSICGDHPIYINYWLKLMKNTNNAHLILSDENQYNYVNKYYPWIKTALIRKLIGWAIENKKYETRKYEVYFGGSYYDIDEQYKIISNFDEQAKQDALNMINYILENEGMPLETALELTLEQRNMVISKDEFTNYLEKFIPVDIYIRGRYRNYFIESALKSNANVTICGNNWEKSELLKYPNLTLIGSVTSMDKAYELMADSKMMINIMPWSYNGFHDRIVNALRAGTICITNKNCVLEEVFQNGKNIKSVGLNEGDEITRFINWALVHEKEAAEIAKAAKNKGDEYFSTKSFCKEILNYISHIK